MTRKEIQQAIDANPGRALYIQYGRTDVSMFHAVSKTAILKAAKDVVDVKVGTYDSFRPDMKGRMSNGAQVIVLFNCIDAAKHSPLEPQDLGHGWTLKFQRSTRDATKVRAVIYTDKGVVWVAGEVVDESEAFKSRFTALANSQKKNYAAGLGLDENATQDEMAEALLSQFRNMQAPPPSTPTESEGDTATWHIRLHRRVPLNHGFIETWCLFNGVTQESSPFNKDTVRKWRDEHLKRGANV